ncbi:MAG: hypothetical protein K2K87_00520 [Lachnospiraceae bacterium]|nr:hypothetical protein [Lachnospiraceae bacterium]
MKKDSGKKKKTMIVLGILLAVILLVPIPIHYKDGGSVEYRAILYSVKSVHALAPLDSGQTYYEGTVVTILGFKVFDNVNYSFRR